MKLAVVGCCHGELDRIYECIQEIEQKNDIKIDLLLICGDFQAVRNAKDLESMAVPPKYATLNTFWKYYGKVCKAPILTLVIGGNHESSNYMTELPYGGWLAPNIYYFGHANVLNYGNLRIAGLSGIYNEADFMRGHFEHPPFTSHTVRSVYHVRNLEIFRLKQLSGQIDIFISHDWPRGIYNCGDTKSLFARKPFLFDDVQSNKLGSPANQELLSHLKPRYWFSAHHHVKFSALVDHGDGNVTRFLALDKCLPKRDFLQIIDLPNQSCENNLSLDPEWLCILRSTDHLLSVSSGNVFMPGPGSRERYIFTPSKAELDAIIADFEGNFTIPSFENTFTLTAPVHTTTNATEMKKMLKAEIYTAYSNPQTELITAMLDIRDPVTMLYKTLFRKLGLPTGSCEDSGISISPQLSESKSIDYDDGGDDNNAGNESNCSSPNLVDKKCSSSSGSNGNLDASQVSYSTFIVSDEEGEISQYSLHSSEVISSVDSDSSYSSEVLNVLTKKKRKSDEYEKKATTTTNTSPVLKRRNLSLYGVNS